VAGGSISVHVLSDSLGETGEMVARAVVAQFDSAYFHIERLRKVTTPDQLRAAVQTHCGPHCVFLYTLVDSALRDEMAKLVAQGVHGVDLLGPSVDVLASVAGRHPYGEAGAMHRTDDVYFERIEATEFAVMHDDGRNPEDLLEADVVLVGVSRTSKTPLAMYLAFKGYRVANVPLAPGVEPPRQLFDLDPRKVFGLVTEPTLLIRIRRERMRDMGAYVPRYADREAVELELEEARALMRRIGCIVVRTDNRAVEESAQEILRYVEGAFATKD
jgi:[pyruvate, water dikinase]-phosphate phosphotransferase / [pyruvate, water dikinase] kinase